MSSSTPAPDGAAPEGALPGAPPKKKRSLFRRIVRQTVRAIFLGGSLAFILIAAFTIWILWFFPNSLVAGIVEEQAAGLGIALEIGTLDVRPLEGFIARDVTLDVEANRAAGAPPVLSVGKFFIRWSARDLLRDYRVHVERVDIENPRVVLHQTAGVWNVQRVLDTLMPPVPGATPAPAPTPAGAPLPLEEQIAMQVATVDSMLAMVPMAVDLDSLVIVGAGADVVTDAGTIARVSDVGATVVMHVSSGGGMVEAELHAEPGIAFALQPGGGSGFSGTLKPKKGLVRVDFTETVTFDADLALEDAVALGGGVELPLSMAAKGKGTLDIPLGDLTLVAENLDVGGFLDAKATLDVDGLGVNGIHATWSSGIHGGKLPAFVTDGIIGATAATALHPGMSLEGSLEGKLEMADPAAIQASIAKGRLPLTLALKSTGVTDEDLIAIAGVSVGKIAHVALVDVSPERITLDGGVEITGVRMDALLPGKPFTVSVKNELEVSADLDRLVLESLRVQMPETGIAIAGNGSLEGLDAAVAAWLTASGKRLDAVPSAFAAITVLRDIDLGGSFRFSAPEELEIASGAFLEGRIDAKARLVRHADPYGRLTADIVYEDFGARIAGTPPKPDPKKKSSKAKPAPVADTLLLEGMTAHLVMDREVILGGTPKAASADDGVLSDERAVFDPATRGYYDRLGSLRAETDNFRIKRILAPPLKISDLSAEVLYDGTAVHVNRGRMQLLGGEVVGRAILRPTTEGLHVALSGDVSGIDMSPLLLERPVGDPNDTRVHMSSAASFFLSKDDPVGSLADMRMRLDVTAAGSKVLDTLLAWLDPEFKDPMFNWARSVNKKVVGVTRPQFSAVADHGMYDVNVAFPSLGLSKDVKRIPLAPLFNLRFTKDTIGGLAPPGDLLPLLAARGIDGNGAIVLPADPAYPDFAFDSK